MDWFNHLNLSVKYIEDRLDKEIDISKAAKTACCSVHHYQRMFSYIAGITLNEYIRNRRLTLAAYELQNSDISVIDVSLKYGYTSPTAFTRAFYKLHGINPSEAKKKGAMLKSYPKINFEISVSGKGELIYRIEEKSQMRFVGIKENVFNDGIHNFIRIPQIWDEAYKSGVIWDIFNLSNRLLWGTIGIITDYKDDAFDFYIASTSDKPVSDNMSELFAPKGLWVIFSCYGRENIQPTWKRIYSEWFPMSGYEHSGGSELECYSEDDSVTEIWIPIKKLED